eukprot:6088235-Prymnesium_polylepis.1
MKGVHMRKSLAACSRLRVPKPIPWQALFAVGCGCVSVQRPPGGRLPLPLQYAKIACCQASMCFEI